MMLIKCHDLIISGSEMYLTVIFIFEPCFVLCPYSQNLKTGDSGKGIWISLCLLQCFHSFDLEKHRGRKWLPLAASALLYHFALLGSLGECHSWGLESTFIVAFCISRWHCSFLLVKHVLQFFIYFFLFAEQTYSYCFLGPWWTRACYVRWVTGNWPEVA